MCFCPKTMANLFVPDISLYGTPLSFVNNCKYLGVVIDRNLDDDDDIRRHVKSLYTRGNILISRFRFCSEDVKLKLFRSFLRNAYGCHLWTKYKHVTLGT